MTEYNHFYFTDSSEHDAWLGRVQEKILDPELPIVDAHHHLWMREPPPYLFREYLADVSTGHNVVATVFAECRSMYRKSGPVEMRPVGESEFVAGIAAMSDSGRFGPTQICKVMFGAVDMTLGAAVEPVLDAHEAASGGRFRGIRAEAAHHPGVFSIRDDPGYLRQPPVRVAIDCLAKRGLSLDIWVFHTQLDQVTELAEIHPDLTIILNHFGAPILGGPFKGKSEEVFADWQQSILTLAQHENVVFKLGALPMRKSARSDPDLPPTSDDIAGAWKPWTEAAIDAFSPARCMFESNFPVDKRHYSYPVLWNAFKKLASGCSESEKRDLFAGTAERAYRIGS